MRAQGLPVNIIVLTALGLIVLVVVAAFFITGMSGAAQQTGVVEADQAYCNGLCGQMVVAANNANSLADLNSIAIARKYQGSGCARQFGCCTVTLRTGEQVCAMGSCESVADCDYLYLRVWEMNCGGITPYWGTGSDYEVRALGVGEKFPIKPKCEAENPGDQWKVCLPDSFTVSGSAECLQACQKLGLTNGAFPVDKQSLGICTWTDTVTTVLLCWCR